MHLMPFNGRPDVYFLRPVLYIFFNKKLSGSHSPDVLCFFSYLARRALNRASFDHYDFRQSCAV